MILLSHKVNLGAVLDNTDVLKYGGPRASAFSFYHGTNLEIPFSSLAAKVRPLRPWRLPAFPECSTAETNPPVKVS